MLHGYIFDRVSVLLRDMHFENTRQANDEGPEKGVRVELRLREPQDWRGSEFAAQRVVLDQPVWRADIFVAVGSPPDSFDRTHYHSRFEGLEPVSREWSDELTQQPFEWLRDELGDLTGVLERAGVADDGISEADGAELRRAAPEIAARAREVFGQVQAGELTSEVNRPFV
ncbi:hypothetical protein [Saccharopolyspora taberi]|uniref:Uncharacterized protein n=1 Tax=Saccharopolyspora taberi TaxID=60895 RepID=A0ABN3VEN2_9PSEU